MSSKKISKNEVLCAEQNSVPHVGLSKSPTNFESIQLSTDTKKDDSPLNTLLSAKRSDQSVVDLRPIESDYTKILLDNQLVIENTENTNGFFSKFGIINMYTCIFWVLCILCVAIYSVVFFVLIYKHDILASFREATWNDFFSTFFPFLFFILIVVFLIYIIFFSGYFSSCLPAGGSTLCCREAGAN